MSWILSILIFLYIVFSFVGIIIATDTGCMDHKWHDLEWYEKGANIINCINMGIILIFMVTAFVVAIHYVLMEIPAVKEFFIRHEWN